MPWTEAEIHAAVQTYLSRSDTALAQLKSERRPGRPASTKQTLLEQSIKTEKQEYEAGFWIPDLRDEDTVKKVAEWKGQWNGLGTMRFCRVVKEGGVRESAFPPRGAA